MKRIAFSIPVLGMCAVLALTASCAKKREEEPAAGQQRDSESRETISYLDEEVVFGLYFDEEGTQRTMRLDRGRKEFDLFLIVDCPEHVPFISVEWRLEQPDGVELINDRYRWDRIISLGTIDRGLSENYRDCLHGPRILLHTLTFRVTGELSDAAFAVMPGLKSGFLGIAECREGHQEVRGISYQAIVNPTDR